jgi:hypothetical protein
LRAKLFALHPEAFCFARNGESLGRKLLMLARKALGLRAQSFEPCAQRKKPCAQSYGTLRAEK